MSHPHRSAGNHWAMWWGISLAVAFLIAATVSFTIDDRATRATSFNYAVR